MFGRKKKPAPPPVPASSPRDTLFGDAALADWPRAAANEYEPWSTFIQARNALAEGRTEAAIELWKHIINVPQLESRHYLQAWHFLRSCGVRPPAEREKELLGVVLEVPMERGLDLLAAYPERTARYYNYSGAGSVWERPDASLDPFIEGLLTAGHRVLNAIGPSDEPRRPAPPFGQLRLNLLSPSGLHFGQGTFETLGADPIAKPVIDAGVVLMKRLIAKSQPAPR